MYRTLTLLATLFFVIAGSVPTYALAQSGVLHQADTSLFGAIARSGAASKGVRVASPLTGRVEGDGIVLRDENILLTSERGVRSIPAVDVDSVWVRRGTAALLVAIITAAPCAAYGGFIGGALATDNGNSSASHVLSGVLHGGALFGIACGSVGAAIGSLINRWQLEYPRPPGRLVREK